MLCCSWPLLLVHPCSVAMSTTPCCRLASVWIRLQVLLLSFSFRICAQSIRSSSQSSSRTCRALLSIWAEMSWTSLQLPHGGGATVAFASSAAVCLHGFILLSSLLIALLLGNREG